MCELGSIAMRLKREAGYLTVHLYSKLRYKIFWRHLCFKISNQVSAINFFILNELTTILC